MMERRGDERMKTVYSLREFDVLCGRRNGANNRRGNVEFRQQVEELKGRYGSAKREDKVNIAAQIVERVHSKGGRFLTIKGDVNERVYLELGFDRSCLKCCQALRENKGGRCKTADKVLQMERALEKLAAMQSNTASAAKKEIDVVPPKAKKAKMEKDTKKRKPHPSALAKLAAMQSSAVYAARNEMDPDTPRAKDTKRRKTHPTGEFDGRRYALWQGSRRVRSKTRSKENSSDSEDSDSSQDNFRPNPKETTEMDSCSAMNERSEVTESDSKMATHEQDISQIESLASRRQSVRQDHQEYQEYQDGGPIAHRLIAQKPASTHVPHRTKPSGWFCDFMNGGNSDANSPSNRACFENLFRSLVQFKEVHGHCAIPPSAGSPEAGSSKEEREFARLADWASFQRCLGRAVRSGRKIPTEEEKSRLVRLTRLGFVFDYDEWHWNKKYSELVRFQREVEKRRKSGQVNKRPSIDFSRGLGLALWIKEQRHLYTEGSEGKMSKMREDRLAKLGKLNFSWVNSPEG